MNNQYFISNLIAKVGQMSMKDDSIFNFVQQEKISAIESSSEPISIKNSHVCENEKVLFSTNKSLDDMDRFLGCFMAKIIELKLTKIATNTILGIFREYVEKMHIFNCVSIQLHPKDDIVNVLKEFCTE